MAIYTIASSVEYYHRILNSEPTKLVVDSLTESINLHIQGQKYLVQQTRKNMQELDLSKLIRNKGPLNMVGKFSVKKLMSNYEEYWEKKWMDG